MNHDARDFARVAGGAALLSAPLALGCLALSLGVVGFEHTALADPAATIGLAQGRGEMLRAAMALDLFGYYLLLAPAILALFARHGSGQSPQGWVVAFCGLAYVMVGAAGAAIYGAAGPPLI